MTPVLNISAHRESDLHTGSENEANQLIKINTRYVVNLQTNFISSNIRASSNKVAIREIVDYI